ncbi:MAG: 2-amino-4-hydroxy-6-hydroxymethyldihydropteridine diphosphokinase [Opitutaceae bacterium]|nr:2-amino-4-hydroxy-6-hydroxymethyldihydropteridine diphosphokinase [Opitutaceae bacterium]
MPASARQAFIGVGANLGDRWATIRGALAALARASGIESVEASAVYETAPVGVVDQPKFLNLVAGIETTLAPEVLIAGLHQLEKNAGRCRELEQRWGPRPLDLDLLLYEGETRPGPELALPHPRMWERAFVLVPLRELIERSARFQRPAWTEVRARLAAIQATADVTRWTPPPA